MIEAMQAKGDITKHLDCIITDIEMPLMDGHRLTKLVKSDAELRDIPVIIFSSLVNERDEEKRVNSLEQTHSLQSLKSESL